MKQQDSFLKKVITLALPVALQTALVACLALADVLMVSDFGESASAAVGAASKWHFVAVMIMAGLAGASGSLIAQYWGKGAKREAKTVSVLSIQAGVYLFIPITLFIALFSEQMLGLQSKNTEVIQQGSVYLLVSLPLLVLTHIIICWESSLRSSGQTWLPLGLGAFTILVNIALNYWFINGGLGLPAMGVAGAALATTVSRVFQLLACWLSFTLTQHWLLAIPAIKNKTALADSYKRLATPMVINFLMWAAGTLVYQILIGQMGTSELAIISILGPFESLCYSVFFGLSVACAVVIGQALGNDAFSAAEKSSRQFIMITLAGSMGLGVLVLINRENLLQWLGLDTVALSTLASPALLVISLTMWLKMMNLVLINGILRAGGENKFCLRTDFKAMWLVGIPLTAYGVFLGGWSFEYVFLAMYSEEVVKLSYCLRHYFRKAWQNNLTLNCVQEF